MRIPWGNSNDLLDNQILAKTTMFKLGLTIYSVDIKILYYRTLIFHVPMLSVKSDPRLNPFLPRLFGDPHFTVLG